MKPRKVDKPLVLYGMGKLGKLALEIFTELGVDVFAGIDRDMPFNFHASAREKCLIAVCIASEPYGPIAKHLQDVGWPDVVPVWDILEAYADKTGLHNGWFAGETTAEDQEGVDAVIHYLGTDRTGWISWYHYRYFVEWRKNRTEPFLIEWAPIEPRESLPSTLADIRARQKVMLWSNRPIHYPVVIHTEGKEMETLKANILDRGKRSDDRSVFHVHRPEIHVTCYHSHDGLWKIPKFLMDNLEDYRFRFRLHAYQGQGAVLYAIPNERGDVNEG